MAKFFILNLVERSRLMNHTHIDPAVILTTFEAFRNKISRKKSIRFRIRMI
jgi:hypothetical protein